LSPEKISVIHIGVNSSDYQYVNSGEKKRTIGYISRMCYENGLDILVDAFILLKKHQEYDDVKLIITGGNTGDDKAYLKNLRKKLERNGLLSSVDFHKEFEGGGRKEFFANTSIISVPVRNGEAVGIYIAESLASGIPVVQPALGAFPEVLAKTGGGIIYGENKPEVLSSALKQMLDNPDKLKQLSQEAREGAVQFLNINNLAMDLVDVYQQVTLQSIL